MKNENTPAFPYQTADGYFQNGMTLRDWMAGMALQSLLAHASGEDPHKCPDMAYKLADTMMKARECETEYTRTDKVNELLEGVRGGLDYIESTTLRIDTNEYHMQHDTFEKLRAVIKAINEFMGVRK